MKKERTRLSQKIGLMAVGIILALICVEFFLRISGIIFLLYRGGFDNDLKGESNSYKILCLGDSFTLGLGAGKGEDYPSQLEKMLNRSRLKKEFLVVNKGRPGQNSSELLYFLDRDLDRYNPDLAVVMIGMNDGHNPHLHNWALGQKGWYAGLISWMKGLRIYKLGNLGRRSIKKLQNENRPRPGGLFNSQNEDGHENKDKAIYRDLDFDISKREEPILDRAIGLFESGQNEEAKVLILEMANEENIWECINLAKIYNAYDIVERSIQKVLKINPGDEWLYFTLGILYESQHRWDETESVFKAILENNPSNDYIRYDLAELYIQQKRFTEAESLLYDAIRVHGESLKGNKLLFNCYEGQGNKRGAGKLRKKIRLYEEITDLNVSAIKTKVSRRRVELIIMSYPQDNYISKDTIHAVTFIDNKEVFKNFPENERARLFSADNDHCSAEGYKVIAENVLKYILKIERT